MKNSKNVFVIILFLGVLIFSGCSQNAENETVTDTQKDAELTEQDGNLQLSEDAKDVKVDNSGETDETVENAVDTKEGNDGTDKCIESGGVYSTILNECHYKGESSGGSANDKKVTDDPNAQKCIDEGGVYNSMVEECFK